MDHREREDNTKLLHHAMEIPPEEMQAQLHLGHEVHDKGHRSSDINLKRHQEFEKRQAVAHAHHTVHNNDPHYVAATFVLGQQPDLSRQRPIGSLNLSTTATHTDTSTATSFPPIATDTSWIRNITKDAKIPLGTSTMTVPKASSSSSVKGRKLYHTLKHNEAAYARKILQNRVIDFRRFQQKHITKTAREIRQQYGMGCTDYDSDTATSASGAAEDEEKKEASHTMNNSLLGSAEERESDMWQYDFENWCKHRKIKPALKVTLNDKVSLRRWFAALDEDGSGEVSIDELENPMISAGILKTHDEVRKCLAIWDKDNSGTISFDEFVDSLRGNELVDKSKLDQLRAYSHDEVFSMDTLLMGERRKNVQKFILEESELRSKKYDDAARHLLNVASQKHDRNVEHHYQHATKKFDDIEHETSIRTIQTEAYLKDLGKIVKHSRDVYNALDYLDKTDFHFKEQDDREEYMGVKLPTTDKKKDLYPKNAYRRYDEYKPIYESTKRKKQQKKNHKAKDRETIEKTAIHNKAKEEAFQRELDKMKDEIIAKGMPPPLQLDDGKSDIKNYDKSKNNRLSTESSVDDGAAATSSSSSVTTESEQQKQWEWE